jgi:predicted membrane-bound mannosyltransferase
VNWSEGLILALAAVGFVAALRRKPPSDAHAPLLRFFAFYTALLAILYSAIPYKTPWCLLTMLDGMIVLAGVGLVALVRWAPGRPVKITLGLAIAALLVQLGVQAWRTNTAYAADRRNPYVYAHTSTDCINLVRRVEAVAAASPKGRGLLIRVVADDYWPLPWYLRAFPNVGWGEAPDPPDADILILSPEAQDWADAHLRGKYVTLGAEGLRPEVFVSMYVEASLWDAFVKGNGRRAAP